MSTVLLTLAVVAVSSAVATKLAASGDGQPATEVATTHRAPRRERRRARRATAASREAAVLDEVPPRPGLFVRLRAAVGLVVIVVVVGGGIALGILTAAQVISQALETAVE